MVSAVIIPLSVARACAFQVQKFCLLRPAPPARECGGLMVYTVKAGDSLYSIAGSSYKRDSYPQGKPWTATYGPGQQLHLTVALNARQTFNPPWR